MSRDFVAASSEGLDGTQNTIFNAQAYPVLFSAWINFDIENSPYTFIEVRDVGAANTPRMQLTKTGDDNVQYFIKDTASSIISVIDASSDIMTLGNWYHVLGWSDSASSHDLRVTALGGAYGGISAPTTVTSSVNWSAMDQTHIGYLGNFGGVNHFDGRIAEVGCWDGTIPDDGQRRGLAAGYSPDNYPNGLRSYPPLMGRASPEPDIVSGDTFALVGTPTAAKHPRIIRPSNRSVFFVPAAAPVSGRIMSSLVASGGLAGQGGIAGPGGGLAG